ncbi:MAG TPA: nickel-binding protein [Roseiarcus sp.]|nr:nickel-binding protein [Roseiarcus sp.]
MPIFMDRHDVRGVKQEDIADLHRRDLEVQDQYNVKYMTYWFDHERCSAFCLVDAPDAAAAERVHREAHGQVANAIIPVDLATVEAFLGRIGDPRAAPSAAPAMDAGLRAIMFTDLVGSTDMTSRLGDNAALELVRVHDALVRRGLEAHGGREVKHTGDGIMASFDKVANAVRGAADIQRRFAAYNADASETLSVRIGIHAGEPVQEHNDLFGATVQLASRLCSEAGANEIVVSDFVLELCEGDSARFAPLGERRLKGFPDKIPVFRFDWRN